ncbi:hypothetical protein AB1046_00695 [Promicromonospora sp. Populi]|uniref:hypothetical protein n=1 Tax=Promicromonospora sp. Populi TaxID=3239420 RepID=UPI0034E224EB
MRRSSTVRHAILVWAIALAAALAVPAAASTSVVSQPETNKGEQIAAENRTATPSASDQAASYQWTANQPAKDQVAADQPAKDPVVDRRVADLAADERVEDQAVIAQSQIDQVAATATALTDLPGYAGVVVDYDAATVTVSWKGQAPPEISALTVPEGVTLDVRQTALSEADLRAASTRLLDGQRAASTPAVVLTALPAENYAGLVVEVSRDSVVASGGAPGAESAVSLTQRLQRVAGVPVRIKLIDHQVESTAGTRFDDQTPWHAGGAIAGRDGTDYCSTGFAVVTGAGYDRIVTAAHCNQTVGSIVRDGAGQRLGTVSNRALGLDAQLIEPVRDSTTSSAVFGGPWDASPTHPRYRFPVATVQRPAVGQEICSSGAVTGEHCATVRATDIAWTCGEQTCHGFRASRDDGGVVVGGGDSGGPMYTVINGVAHALGMVDGGSDQRPCGRTSLPTQCFTYVYGIPMVDILNQWSATIRS